MLNRILILFGNEFDKENLLKTGKHLQDKYKATICGLYIKDIRKYEVLPPTVEGLVVDNSANYLIREWEKSEDIQSKKVEEVFKEYFPKSELFIEEGIASEIVQEKLLGFDLIIMEKGKTITSNQKELLSNHYKPVLLIPEKVNLKIEKIMIANDKGERSNKSTFSFLNLFDKLDCFTSISVNLQDESDEEFGKYMKIIGKNLIRIEEEGDPFEIIVNRTKEFDILIMGDLKYPFLLERLTGNAGIKLLEHIEIPIFLG